MQPVDDATQVDVPASIAERDRSIIRNPSLTTQSEQDPSFGSLPLGAHETNSSPFQVMRREEAARLLALNRVMRWLSVFMLATLPFFGGDSTLRYILIGGLAVGLPGGFVFDHMIKSEAGVTKGTLVASALAIGVNLYVGILFFGTFSGATAIVVLGLFIACRTEHQEVGLVLYLLYACAQGLFGCLIIFDVMPDPGILQMRDRPLFEDIVVLTLIEGMYLAGFLLGRATRQITFDAMNEAEEARRKVGQRDALLREARQDLDQALQKVGGPGHYTDQKIGSYVLGIVIGRGAMAEVYEGQNVETGQTAAIKLLHQNLLVQPKAVTRFLREAQAASALDTPHVARILESSDPLDVLPYLAMERLRGNDLAHYLRHKPVMSMKRLLELVEQVAKVIDLANDAGIVHRDLKPQNIYLAEQETGRSIWKVLDFGVSLLGEGSGTLTQGNIVGTPSYMSPEQAKGGKVDQRTDIHALAAITYRCLTGRPPFSGNDIPSIMYSAVHSMPEPPSFMTDVPGEIDSVLAIGLAKKAEDRFESAADFSFRLQRAAKGELDPRLKAHADTLLAKLPWGAEELSRKKCEKRLDESIETMRDLQRILYAHDHHSVLLVFQAMDAAGKDSTIRAVMTGVNPAGCKVVSFKKPSVNELDQDFLWRSARVVPERGRIGIFNRSYYEEVLVVRVHPEYLGGQNIPGVSGAGVSEEFWQERMESIRDHEKHLARNGTLILKFFLNVSRDEQKSRFIRRIDRPDKNWKFNAGDVQERGHWPAYMAAYQAALRETSRPWAPWFAIPADEKPYMRMTVADIVVQALEGLDLKYPKLDKKEQSRLAEMRQLLEDEDK